MRAALFTDVASVTPDDVLWALKVESYAATMPRHVSALYKRRPDLVAPTFRQVVLTAIENRVFEENVRELLQTVAQLWVQNKINLTQKDLIGENPTRNEAYIQAMRQLAIEARFIAATDAPAENTAFQYAEPLSGPIRGLVDRKALRPQQPITSYEYHPYTTEYDEIVRPQDIAAAMGWGSDFAPTIANMQQQADARLGFDGADRATVRIVNGFTTDLGRAVRRRMQAQDIQPENMVVTLLLDNSGSLRGKGVWTSLLLTNHLASALERAHVQTEILGFTTVAWKGGNARRMWSAAGKPRNPGRLNDLRHIIYKDASETWDQARTNLAIMLREGFLKENIDGEALLWAKQRMDAHKGKNTVLILINDGVPVDDATLSVNAADYLQRHFDKTADYIQRETDHNLSQVFIGNEGHIKDNAIANRTTVPQETEAFYAEVRPSTIARMVIPTKFKIAATLA